MVKKVLVVDDERVLAETIGYNLRREGYAAVAAYDGQEALQAARREKPDAVILDVMLPKLDGFEVCRALRRETGVPILMLTAREGEIDKVLGLELGADDYLTKPFNPEELSARLRAVLRRTQGPVAVDEHNRFVAGDVEVDLDRRRVTVAGDEVSLSPTEWQLLANLISNAGRVILHEDLLGMTWGPEYRNDLQYLRVWISRLRRKLGGRPGRPSLIRTVPGVGYIIKEGEAEAPGTGPDVASDSAGDRSRADPANSPNGASESPSDAASGTSRARLP